MVFRCVSYLLAHAIGAPAEALRGRGQVVGLVLEVVDVLSALADLHDVLLHNTDRVCDLLPIELKVSYVHLEKNM